MTILPASPRRGTASRSAVRAHWLTCALDGRDHAVVDHDPVSGAHLSACAKTVWASSLASPPAARCSDCRHSVGDTADDDRRSGLLGRWLRSS
ncbi:hypothetical protein [Actinomycetospora sp.]|jgi:hypothetical protein|uniref:hypothetical protein n=1 Tax=Actinomycetospora sp. TaxID=1872135 RepID=UPI002F3E9CE1